MKKEIKGKGEVKSGGVNHSKNMWTRSFAACMVLGSHMLVTADDSRWSVEGGYICLIMINF